VASLTLIAPGIAPRVDASPWTKLRIGLALLLRPWGRFEIPLDEPELFTDNPAGREYIAADPLRLRRATAKFFWASRRLDRMIARAPEGAVDAPTTLLLADRDRIIDNARTREIVARLTAGRAEVRTFHAAHTLEFEPDPSAFHAALLAAVARGD
jgi:alpha-beta hydrolase superfamily lysophospholipase